MSTAFLLGSDAPPCLSLTEVMCDFRAYGKFYSQDVKTLCSSECPLECEQQTFSVQVSSLTYPTQAYYEYLKKQPSVVEKFGVNASEITYDEMKNSILRFSVFYETLSYIKIEETAKVQIFDVISGIGGTMGLFMVKI